MGPDPVAVLLPRGDPGAGLGKDRVDPVADILGAAEFPDVVGATSVPHLAQRVRPAGKVRDVVHEHEREDASWSGAPSMPPRS